MVAGRPDLRATHRHFSLLWRVHERNAGEYRQPRLAQACRGAGRHEPRRQALHPAAPPARPKGQNDRRASSEPRLDPQGRPAVLLGQGEPRRPHAAALATHLGLPDQTEAALAQDPAHLNAARLGRERGHGHF